MILIVILCVFACFSLISSISQIVYLSRFRGSSASILPQDLYDSAIDIGIQNERFDIISHLYTLAINAFFILFGFSALRSVVDTGALNGALFVVAYLLCMSVLSLPLGYYKAFVKDKKQGFSTISLRVFIKDTIKSLALLCIFGTVLAYCVLLCFGLLGKHWWIGGFAISFAFVLGANIIYPNFIIPLFNKLTPLDDESLSSDISELLSRAGFSASGVYVMDASKRDSRLNAFFAGIGRSKKVVLFDTLLSRMPREQLLAVLGHELGHFMHKDVLKNIFFAGFMFFVMFYALSLVDVSVLELASLDGFDGGYLVFLMIFAPVVLAPLGLVMAMMSRHCEYAADKAGAHMRSKSAMIDALRTLASENKAFISSSWLKSLTHSHPSIADRIRALESI